MACRTPSHLDNAHETNSSIASPVAIASPRGPTAGPSGLNPSLQAPARGTGTSSLRGVSPATSPVWQAMNPFNNQEQQQQRQPRDSDPDAMAVLGGGLGSGAPSLTSSISLGHHSRNTPVSSSSQGQLSGATGAELSLAGGMAVGGSQHAASSAGLGGNNNNSSTGSSSGGPGLGTSNASHHRLLAQQRSDPVQQGGTAVGTVRPQSTPGGLCGQQQQEQVSQRMHSMSAAVERGQHGAGGGGGVKPTGGSPRLGPVGEGPQEGVGAVQKGRAAEEEGEARPTGWFSGRSSES
jgi:hypothetical protein